MIDFWKPDWSKPFKARYSNPHSTAINLLFRCLSRSGEENVPRERSGHRIIYHEGSIYAFGGYNPSLEDDPAMQTDPSWANSKPLFKELWKFNTYTSKWSKMPMHGVVPSQLASHTATLLDIRGQTPKMMVYGGTGTPYGVITSYSIFILGKKSSKGQSLRISYTLVKRGGGGYEVVWWHLCYPCNSGRNKGRHVTLKYFSILKKIDKEHRHFIGSGQSISLIYVVVK